MGRRPLDEFEAEVRDTRRRLAALLAHADRHYGLRAGLNGLRHFGDGGEPAGLWRRLAVPAATLAFVAGLVGAGRSRGACKKTDC